MFRHPLGVPLPDEGGILLELVACELHRRMGDRRPEAALFQYRTRSAAEVDFVLEVGCEIWRTRVKASRRVDRWLLSGVPSLSRRPPRRARRIVVSLGARRQLVVGLEAVPLKEFLAELPG